MAPTLKRFWGRLVNYRLQRLTDAVRRARGWSTTDQWRNGARAHASRYGLEDEVVAEFDHNVRQGAHPSIAQTHAFWEWDI
jgi:hypothetical protein